MDIGGQSQAPTSLPPGKKPGTTYTGGWVAHKACLGKLENLAQLGFDPRTVQPVESRYIDCTHLCTPIKRK